MSKESKKQVGRSIHGAFSKAIKPNTLALLDKRTKFGKAVAALRHEFLKDLGMDISIQESILLDRVISKVLQCSIIERRLLEGHEENRPFYISLSNSLRLDLLTLGLERKSISIDEDKKKVLKALSTEELISLRDVLDKLKDPS